MSDGINNFLIPRIGKRLTFAIHLLVSCLTRMIFATLVILWILFTGLPLTVLTVSESSIPLATHTDLGNAVILTFLLGLNVQVLIVLLWWMIGDTFSNMWRDFDLSHPDRKQKEQS